MPPIFNPPGWEQGVDLSQVSITGYSKVGTTWTAGTTYNVWAVTDEIEHSVEEETEDIGPVWDLQMNEMLTRVGNAVSLTCLKTSTAPQQLAQLKQNYPVAYVVWQEPHEQWNGFYRVGRFNSGIRGRGAQRVRIDFRPINPGGAQVSYVTS